MRVFTTGFAGATLVAACGIGVVGCASSDADGAPAGASLSADANLLAPPTEERYIIESDSQSVTLTSDGLQQLEVSGNASGSIIVSDGIISEAQITANLSGGHRVDFELSEPLVFERHGQLAEQIVGVGTLSTRGSVYHDVRVVFTPKVDSITGTADRVRTVVQVPGDLVSTRSPATYSLDFVFTLDQLLLDPTYQSERHGESGDPDEVDAEESAEIADTDETIEHQ